MELSVKIESSESGAPMAIVTLGWCTVEIYESQMRQGGITVQIDCETDDQLPLLAIDLHEARLHPAEES